MEDMERIKRILKGLFLGAPVECGSGRHYGSTASHQSCNGRRHKFWTTCDRCGDTISGKSRRCGKACEVFDPTLDTPEKIRQKFIESEIEQARGL